MGIAYTGASGATLRTCLFKDRAKQALVCAGIRTPQAMILHTGDELPDDSVILPGIVKLLHEDASIGMTSANVATSATELRARARELITEHRQPVIVERYVTGREVNVSVLGTGAAAMALPLHEINFAAMPQGSPHIVSYAAKWDEQHPEYLGTQPTRLRDVSPALRAAITQTALETYNVLGVRDFGRVDLRIDEHGVPWVIDVNPNCDVSPDAGFVRAAKAAGLGYPELLRTICELAFDRASSSVRSHVPERAATSLLSR
jgi:D-alanine-D-alanine ligase